MSSTAPDATPATAGDRATHATLRQQQQALAAALLHGGADPGTPHHATTPAAAATTAGLLRPGPASASGLAIYRHAHGARLRAALRDNFGVLAQALGDTGFDALADAYTAAHPPAQPSIRWLGHRLAEFMASPAATHAGLVPHPALVDLARMDWALRQAFDAADAAALQAADLARRPAADWPALGLQTTPSTQLLALDWAVEATWRRLRLAQDAAPPDQADDHDSAPDPGLSAPEHQPHALLVWRQGLETRWRSLPAGSLEAQLLPALARGLRFDALCEQAAAALRPPQAAEPPDATGAVVALLQQWLADGLLRAEAQG